MREFKKPDLSAPRYRPEVLTLLNKEFFDSFKKKYPKYNAYDNKALKDIAKAFNKALYTMVIDNRDGVQLPEQIGWLFIGTCQNSKKKNVDFAKSKQYGVEVSNNNFATDGKLAKIFFTNYAPKHKIKNREFWSFTACRDFKRAVSKSYPENWNMYLVVQNTKAIKEVYLKLQYEKINKRETLKKLETYNEFDL
jgi:hypothetical protein